MKISLDVDPFPFQGKTALVGGASRGIGRACAQILAARGANVILLARDETTLSIVKRELPRRFDQNHSILPCDLNDSVSLQKATAKLSKLRSQVSIFINNTGGPAAGPLTDASSQDLSAAFNQHIIATQSILTCLLQGMKDAQFGRVINILSTSVRVPIPGLGVSNTIRAAMAAYSKTLSAELGAHGITVNNVLPGYTATERLDALVKSASIRLNQTEDDIKREWKRAVPLGRFAEPMEVAAAVAFLASHEASYITGQSLAVDGGRIGAI